MKEVLKMKRSNLVTAIMYLFFGLVCLSVVIFTQTRLEGIVWGLCGAWLGSGSVMLYRYFYWTLPKNKERYSEKLKNVQIEQNDELNIKILDKAGRYAYILGLSVICLSILVFSILDALSIINNALTIIFFLCGYLLFQIAAVIIIFNLILKKY